MEGISEDFCFDEIAGDFDHFEPVLHDAMKRLPALELPYKLPSWWQ